VFSALLLTSATRPVNSNKFVETKRGLTCWERVSPDETCIRVSTLAEKLLSIFYFIFFLDTDPHLASVVCDLYLFSVSRYELCVCGNMCTCVRVSTNLESPPIMGNFKV
jgi:hypothetical protein